MSTAAQRAVVHFTRLIGMAPGCVVDPAESAMAMGPRRRCWNGPTCPWRARGICLFGHEHDGPQTCVAPVGTVSREELDQVWKAISRLAASIMWHQGHRTEHEKEEAIYEVSSHDKGQRRMVKQVVEVSEISKKAAISSDVPETHMTEQLVEVPEVDIEIACPSSEAEPDAMTHSSAQSLGSFPVGDGQAVICCKQSKDTTSAPPVGSRSRERCSGTYSLTQIDEEVTSKGNALIQLLNSRKVQAREKNGQAKQFSEEDDLALQTELAAFQRFVSRAYQ